jgi:hypothetical protein
MAPYGLGVRAEGHPVLDREGAGGHEPAAAVVHVLDHAQSAGAEGLEGRVVAQTGDRDVEPPGHVEQGLVAAGGDWTAVDLDCDALRGGWLGHALAAPRCRSAGEARQVL